MAERRLHGLQRVLGTNALHRQMPDRLRQLHRRYQTPYAGILLFSAVACLTLLPGQADFLGSIYAFGAMLSFSMAHLAVIKLRTSDPDHPRPYRSPGRVPFRGWTLPPFAILGLAGTSLSFLVISGLNPEIAATGAAWLVLGAVVYVVYRRRQGLDLVSTDKVAIPEPVVDHEAEDDSVLVYAGEGGYDERLMATARRLAARKRRGIHVLVTINVPGALPLDARMEEQEAAAASLIEQARVQAAGA